MSHIPQHIIDDIIARTDLVELIGSRLSLKKRGQNYLGLCPFHQEKTPSFNVIPQKQFYYCFGCGASGNAIRFLMEYEHRPFLEVISDLSHALGVELPSQNTQEEDLKKQRDFFILEQASQFYQDQLKHSPQAIDYLKNRGLSGQIAKRFGLGYSPPGWDGLSTALQQTGVQTAELIQTGLALEKKQGTGIYDRFRDRIMFPIRQTRGQVIAFGARTLGDKTPKYLNSPETNLFQKSQELYGLYEVLQADYHPEFIVIVEGYMDVIALHQYGLTQAVASLGTATNPKHLQRLLRHTQTVIFCFDGDNAGQQAAFKAVIMSLAQMRDGIQIKFMFLNANDDPDSLIRRIGAEGFKQRLQQAEPLSQVFFKLLKQQWPMNTPDTKAQFAKKATEYLNTMPVGVFRELMFEQLAKLVGVYLSDLDSLAQSAYQESKPKARKPIQRLNPAESAIALLLQEPKLARHAPPLDFDLNTSERQLLKTLIQLYHSEPNISIGESFERLTQEQQSRFAWLATHKFPFDSEGMLAEFNGAIARLNESRLEKELNDLIDRSKREQLSPLDKQRLTQLLSQRAANPEKTQENH